MKCPSCANAVSADRPECPSCGTPLSPSREKRIEELLGRYVEQRIVDGSAADPEELCRESPELLEPLREHIREYEQLQQMLAPPGHLESGDTLLHYRILEKIGAGGMGEVYLAEDTKLERRVALKILSPQTAGDPLRLRRFLREARLEAGLNHPNVVTVYSVEEAEGLAFLTMEVVEGRTLKELIPPGGMDPERILPIAVQIADALVAAHERGIMHRDLKPANVMVTKEELTDSGQAAPGRVKVLDFGLAKLRQPPKDASEAVSTRTLTTGGKILGTLPYMSPEQIQSTGVDLRTDIFSFGVILYEMATGQRPFVGANMAKLISTILRDTPEPVTRVNPRMPQALGRIVERCLEKDPEKRYPSSRELRDELVALRQGFRETREVSVPAASRTRRLSSPRVLAGALLTALAAAAIYSGIDQRGKPDPPMAPPTTESGRPSIAVLRFQNLAGDAAVEWLRAGLTEMLVTDLAQSPEIDVLPTDRLVSTLRDLGAGDDKPLSSEQLEELGQRAGVDTVLEGSFVRQAEELRIDLRIREAGTGDIVVGKRVAGRFETALFGMVDDLSRQIRRHFEVPHRAELATSVEQITTSSLEAWRFFTEARVLHQESKRKEAIALLERAVEIDPDFALALANLGVYHKNLAQTPLAREYTRRAFELEERLPLDQRLMVEAAYYGTRWRTLGRAIEALQELLRLYPHKTSERNPLAKRFSELERYEEAIDEYRILIESDSPFAGNYTSIANAYAGLGQFERGYQILSDFVQRHPDNWLAQVGLGWHLTEWGKLDEALESFERAAVLRPEAPDPHYGMWRVQVLREEWKLADLEAERILTFDGPFARWRGAVSQARNLTYRGRSKEALRRFDDATRAYPDLDASTALVHCWKAELLLQRGEAPQALAEAELAQKIGKDEWPELKGLFLAALAHETLGRPSQADQAEESLQRLEAQNPNVVEKRQIYHLAGLLALARGDAEAAVRALTQAESLLPPQGVEVHWHVYPDHVPIWFDLGQAELASGRPDKALRWFHNAVTSGAEHLESPVPYVLSLYFLGRIHRQRGETAQARRHFTDFLRLWQDGDLDPERVEEARIAVESSSRPAS